MATRDHKMLTSYSHSFDSTRNELSFYSDKKMVASAKCAKKVAESEAFDPTEYIKVTLSDGETYLLEAESLKERTLTLLEGEGTMTALFQNIIENKVSCLDSFLDEVKRVRSQTQVELSRATELQKQDLELTLEAIRRNWFALADASSEMQANKRVVLEAIRQNGSALQFASATLKDDREIVLEAIRRSDSDWILRYASEALKNDREIVLEAVKRKGSALLFASEALKNDREIVLLAIRQDTFMLDCASEALKNDREIVLAAVRQDASALTSASENLKNNREFVLEAVRQNGEALGYASITFTCDREVVLEAVRQKGSALRHADKIFKSDREVVLEAVRQNGLALEFASKVFKSDREVVLEAARQNGWGLMHADEGFKSDREIVLEAVRQAGQILSRVDEAFKNDREIVLEAVKQRGSALNLASEALKNDRELLVIACLYHPDTAQEIVNQRRISIEEVNAKRDEMLNRALEEARLESDPPVEAELTKLLRDTLLNYKNPALFACMCRQVLELQERGELGSVIKKISLMQERLTTAQKPRLIALQLMTCALGCDTEEAKAYQRFYRENYVVLKNGTDLQPVLFLLSELYQRKKDLTQAQLSTLLNHCFIKENFKHEGLKRIKLLTALAQIQPITLKLLTDCDPAHLTSLLISNMTKAELVAGDPTALTDQFLKTFLSSRLPSGIFTYSTHFLANEAMKSPLSTFIQAVLTESLTEFRHSHNSHSHLLSADQKRAWESSIDKGSLNAEASLRELDVEGFLQSKIKDGHAEGVIRQEILLGPLDDKTELETKVQRLLYERAMSLEERLELIDKIESAIPPGVEFKADIRALKTLLLAKKDSQGLRLIDTEDWQDLFLCGTEVLGSCQRIDGDSTLNKGLMGYCLDGKVRMLAVKNATGKIVARALIKLLKKDDLDEPVLFLERLYPDEMHRDAIESLAREKASAMGLKLYQFGPGLKLESLGNVAGVEYEDGGVGISSGAFKITGSEL